MFKKGNKINLGRKHTKETRKKMSESSKGQIAWNKGKKLPPISDEWKEKIRKANTGKKFSEEHKKNIGLARKGKYSGKNHPNWKGGITPINAQIRHSDEYIFWQKAVLKRDNWTCKKCNKRGGDLHVHHIYNFYNNEKIRFYINNGIVLCIKHHREFHKLFGNKKNNKKQINKYLYENNGK